MNSDEIFKKEKEYLENVNENISEEISSRKEELKEIPKKHTNILQGDAYLVESLMSECATRIHSLENAQNSPYFGKFTFVDESGNKKEFCIGRTFLKGTENEYLITDWRAPVSSLFYSSEVGKATYKAPVGEISGNLTSKKQIVINNRELEKVFDTNFASNDEILQEYLNTHADDKMKDIIASIQKEQNEIIRLPFEQNTIVQGIAGSGKTSIALHRLAYLIYTLKEKNSKAIISPKQFLILGPNECFLDYISEVLPSMDIDNVTQETYISLITSELNTKYKILDNNEVLAIVGNNQKAQQIARFKNSKEYKQLLNTFMSKYIDSVFDKDLEIEGVKLISGSDFKKRLSLYSSKLQTSIKELKKFYVRNIKENYIDWENKLTHDLREKAKYIPQGHETKTLIYEKIREISSKCKTGLKTEIDKYFAPLLFTPVDIYKIFIDSINENDNSDLQDLKNYTLELLKKKKLTRDDLIGIMSIKNMISDIDIDKKTLHIIIDEAQDYSKEEFNILKEMFPNATFSIFGDLSQSIYQYRSIRNWEDISLPIFDSEKIFRINKSYRTTDEIIKEADKISILLNNEISLENVRHGSAVNYIKVVDSEKHEFLTEEIQNGLKNGYKSIAIICKTEEETNKLYKRINDVQNLNLITSMNNEYHGGICVIPAALSKGLEFDFVIVVNADNNTYSINDRNDLALLYVAMTRALHKLDVTYNKELFSALENNNSINIRERKK